MSQEPVTVSRVTHYAGGQHTDAVGSAVGVGLQMLFEPDG